jgi:hypothetical protein
MKPQKKLRGQTGSAPKSELTRFKELWRDTFTDSQREYWRAQFVSQTPTKDTRESLRIKFNINLTTDDQIVRFRKWEEQEQQRLAEAEQMASDEEFFLPQTETEVRAEMAGRPEKEILEAIAERLRLKVLNAANYRALATGNFDLGLSAVRASQAESSGKFNAEMEVAKLQLAKDAETRMRETLKLAIEKQRFDAIAACRKQLPALKAIESNKSLSEAEKTQMFMEKLFGKAPTEPRPGNQ